LFGIANKLFSLAHYWLDLGGKPIMFKYNLWLPNQSLKLTREARHENSFSVESNMRLVVHLKCNPRAA